MPLPSIFLVTKIKSPTYHIHQPGRRYKMHYTHDNGERSKSSLETAPGMQHITRAGFLGTGHSVENEKKITAMEHSPVTTEQVSRLTAKTLSWKAPGPDGISNFWIKRFTATHSYLAHHFNKFMEDAGNMPDFLVQGITYLLQKSQDCQDPSKYRPIT